ncbi:MAG: hypothetical protein M1826_007244 [Phylliscum demangeonii]|nr:MAG: hypothetical protein M1826_007244 [Phylliscum demangeonii]
MADQPMNDVNALLQEAEQRLPAAQSAEESSKQSFRIPQLKAANTPKPILFVESQLVRIDSSRVVSEKERKLAEGPQKVEDPVLVKERRQKEKMATAGSDWFNMPRTNLTPEVKRDFQLLRARSVLDPKRHYKKENRSKRSYIPDFSQTGTIIQGPTEFHSARIPNKERRKTFVAEVLGQTDAVTRFKRKYDEVQLSKASGKKDHYKRLKSLRSKGKKK